MFFPNRATGEQFCLESKIRHSTIVIGKRRSVRLFCLESKIRHSTIQRFARCYSP